ncbi:hypothetical protein A3Q56_06109 [Intoshia linei]|uniref:BSD domain-containing protein n=1 Tax=Intoshia linei TaxID=1819745 RepID=A0A177AYC1_9BILA|nr:hypothetical protein A3Q56_06109 [Intoshia linei]
MDVHEDVLNNLKYVRVKKVNGSLYLMKTRIAWMQESKNSFGLSYNYADIKQIKISQPNREKIQLQLVLYESGATTFHFANPNGKKDQLLDRTMVSSYMSEVLPKFKKINETDLKEKETLLKSNVNLRKGYKNLVETGTISTDEFWKHWTRYLNKFDKFDQNIGVPTSFISQLKHQTGGYNQIEYNMDQDTIMCIFKTYPAIKRKHSECVPSQMSEQSFWKHFFESHYYLRDLPLPKNYRDFFHDVVKEEQKDIKLLNQNFGKNNTDDLGYLKDGLDLQSNTFIQNSNPTESYKNLVRSINNYSANILNSLVRQPTDDVYTNLAQIDIEETDDIYEPIQFDSRLNIKTELKRKCVIESQDDQADFAVSTKMLDDFQNWNSNFDDLHSKHSVLQFISEMSSENSSGIKEVQLTPEMSKEYMKIHNTVSEITRHFWMCFPVVSVELENKLYRTFNLITNFKNSQIKDYKEKLIQQHFKENILRHNEMRLDAAISKYNVWKNKSLLRKEKLEKPS